MKFTKYIKDQINDILGFILYGILVIGYAHAMQVEKNVIIIIMIISGVFFISGFLIHYWRKNRYLEKIEKLMDGLSQKYLISEVMQKPRKEENLAYYRILKRANKSMLEKVTEVMNTKKDYKEYIESWVHEIKIPITSAKLLCENNKSDITTKIEEELEEINNYVEQALFYARLDQVSNDFMIRQVKLQEVIKNVLARNKKIMIQNNMKVEVNNIDSIVYADEKWLEFILNQIIINSIKYKKEEQASIKISVEESKENVKLFVRDNGIGIKKSELDRIFDKGFTGTNGRNQKKSTGIGLYLCKRLCQELGMDIEADSQEKEYTQITIIIPRNPKRTNRKALKFVLIV